MSDVILVALPYVAEDCVGRTTKLVFSLWRQQHKHSSTVSVAANRPHDDDDDDDDAQRRRRKAPRPPPPAARNSMKEKRSK